MKQIYIEHSHLNRYVLKIHYSTYSAKGGFNREANQSFIEKKVSDFIQLMNSLISAIPEEPFGRRHHPSDLKDVCEICEIETFNKFRLLNCSHPFCKDCIKDRLSSVTTCKELRCPVCNEYIALYDILCLFSQIELETVYARLKSDYLTEHAGRFKQCPTPSCENVLERTQNELMMFCTGCGYESCFLCGDTHYDDKCSAPQQPKLIPKPKVVLFLNLVKDSVQNFHLYR